MIKVSKRKSSRIGKALEKEVTEFLLSTNRVSSFIFKKRRMIFLDKYFHATNNRPDRRERFQLLFPAIELLKEAGIGVEQKKIDHYTCYEVEGMTHDETIFRVHIREEILHKDRRLYLISTYPIRKKKA